MIWNMTRNILRIIFDVIVKLWPVGDDYWKTSILGQGKYNLPDTLNEFKIKDLIHKRLNKYSLEGSRIYSFSTDFNQSCR